MGNNTALAQIVSIGALAAVGFLIAVLLWLPDEISRRIDTFPIRFLVFVVGLLSIAAIALMLYWLLYLPRAKRFVLRVAQIAVLTLFVSLGNQFLGMPSIEKILIEATRIDVTLGPSVTVQPWTAVAAMFVLLVCMLLYTFISWHERYLGAEI